MVIYFTSSNSRSRFGLQIASKVYRYQNVFIVIFVPLLAGFKFERKGTNTQQHATVPTVLERSVFSLGPGRLQWN